MQVTLTIPDELAAQAKARGVPVESYVRGLLESLVPAPRRKQTPEELAVFFEEFAQFSRRIPVLSDEALTREVMYDDHD